MLTEERIAEIKSRCEAATPGPWELDAVTADDEAPEYDLYPPDYAPIARLMVRCPLPDAAFIAAARQDIPDLLAERAALLRREISIMAEADRIIGQLKAQIAELKAGHEYR